MCLTKEGNAVGFGLNSTNQLAKLNFITTKIIHSKLHGNKKMATLATGGQHTVVITEEGELFGIGNTIGNTWIQMSPEKEFVRICCGWNHTVAELNDNRIIFFDDTVDSSLRKLSILEHEGSILRLPSALLHVEWSIDTHSFFSLNFQKRVFFLLCLWKRFKDQKMLFPKPLIYKIFQYLGEIDPQPSFKKIKKDTSTLASPSLGSCHIN